MDYAGMKEKLRREAEAPPKRGSKKRATKKFVNEIGNPISVLVEETRDTGTNAKTKERSSFDAIRIVITGPTSMSENTLTRQEAVELLRCLEQVLS